MTLLIPHNKSLTDLFDILSLRRRAWTQAEYYMIQTYLLPLGLKPDEFGNYFIKIGDSDILWSCHTDTVHINKAADARRQALHVSADGIVKVRSTKMLPKPDCLGADDGAGVWLMINMIRARVPGLYIFHREEEAGGIGSRFIANGNSRISPYLKNINYAIAFDRKGTDSIITHQGVRTCSDAFAESFSRALGMGHKKDSGGTFTDTKSYYRLIPECTNLSVGYMMQHTSFEQLDTIYLQNLLNALINMDQSELVCKRDPSAPNEYSHTFSYYGGYGSYWEEYEEFEEESYYNRTARTVVHAGMDKDKFNRNNRRFPNNNYSYQPDTRYSRDNKDLSTHHIVNYSEDNSEEDSWIHDYYHERRRTMVNLVESNPEVVADLLEQWGYDVKSLEDDILMHGGVV